jgi:aspartyl protease family protein
MLIAFGQYFLMLARSLPVIFASTIALGAGIFFAQFGNGGAVEVSEPHANAAIVEAKSAHMAEERGRQVEFQRANDGLFYVTGNVNGVPVRFVVDTGASVVVLTQRDAERVGINKDSGTHQAHIQTAGGPSAMSWAKLKDVTVAGQRVEKLDAAIVRDGLKVSLLGQNYLSELDSMMLRGDRLRFN